VNAFTPLLRLKNDVDFTWGAKQQEAFDEIKSYLTSRPVLRAPKSGIPFKLYIAAEKDVIGGILTQETEGKEYIVAYESRRLLDAETRCTFIEKLCLSLYHTCTKLMHYLLPSTCIVACQTDIIKYMFHKPILNGRVGKWAFALVEYDLHCEPLSSMKDQIVANFIVGHRVDKQLDLNVGYVTLLHGSCILMDRFAKMVVVLELSLFRQVGLLLKLLTDWIIIVLITKPNMRLFYLGWRFCMTWE
jgi:hypothetical protein